MKSLDRPLVILGLLALATAILLHGNLTAPFYRIDDQRYVRYATEGPWAKLLRPTRGIFYAPVTYLSFRLDRALFGPPQDEVKHSFSGPTLLPGESTPRDATSPATPPHTVTNWAYGPRLMNGLYHCLAGFLLWWFLRRIGAGLGLAAVVALAWTVHPAALESVAWVCERKNVLCALFGFGALLAWTIPRGPHWRMPLVWLLFALSMFSKPAALGLVPLLVALEVLNPPQGGFAWREGRQWASVLQRLSGVLAVSVAAFIITTKVFAEEIALPPGGSAWTGLLTDTDIFARYTFNVLLPVRLSFFYGVDPVCGLADVRPWLGGGTLLLFWAGMLWRAGARRRPLAVLGLVWFLGALAPTANLIASTFPMQDRYIYLAAPGLLLALGAALTTLAEQLCEQTRALPAVGTGFVGFLAVMCALRSPLFGNDAELELAAARRQPDSGLARWSAAQIRRERFLDHANSPAKDEQELARYEAIQLANELGGALECRDLCDFVDPLTVRVALGEVLIYLGDHNGAREIVAAAMPPRDWRPPPDWRAQPEEVGAFFPDMPATRRHRVRAVSFRESVAKGHVLLGELDLRESFLKGAPFEQRLAHAREAIAKAEQSMAVHPLHDEAPALKGKALLRIAYLYADQGTMAEARTFYESAKKVLSAVPASSPQAKIARWTLEQAAASPPDQPPAPPKTPQPATSKP